MLDMECGGSGGVQQEDPVTCRMQGSPGQQGLCLPSLMPYAAQAQGWAHHRL